MKKVILSAVAAWALVALIGCNHRAEVETVQPDLAELKPMQQSWRGVLPCADCAGIEMSLFLDKEGSWVMNSHYLGSADKNASFATYGTWARTADKLVLTDTQGKKYYYHAKGEALEMLDRDGNPITSPFNHTLDPVTASLPDTPMAMRGMYRSVAGIATFTDCVTEKSVAIDNTVQNVAARGEDKPVLLLVEGHFSLKAAPGTREQVKVLTPDSKMTFVPDKGCEE